jgi:hypothetical protein
MTAEGNRRLAAPERRLSERSSGVRAAKATRRMRVLFVATYPDLFLIIKKSHT